MQDTSETEAWTHNAASPLVSIRRAAGVPWDGTLGDGTRHSAQGTEPVGAAAKRAHRCAVSQLPPPLLVPTGRMGHPVRTSEREHIPCQTAHRSEDTLHLKGLHPITVGEGATDVVRHKVIGRTVGVLEALEYQADRRCKVLAWCDKSGSLRPAAPTPVWSKYSNLRSHWKLRFYRRPRFGLSSAPLLSILHITI